MEPFHWFNFNISNYFHYEVWDGNSYPFRQIQIIALIFLEWITLFPHFTWHVITSPCLKLVYIRNGAQGST